MNETPVRLDCGQVITIDLNNTGEAALCKIPKSGCKSEWQRQ
jgi:hypothetical protein